MLLGNLPNVFESYFISSKAEEKVAEEAECDSVETFLKNMNVDFI